MNRKLKVINLYGSPGTGKSSVRGGLYWLMNSLGESVGEIDEYAKYLYLTNRREVLKNQQMLVLSQQHDKQLSMRNFEYAITDSPLHLSGYFAGPNYLENFPKVIEKACSDFENINFFLTRNLDEGYQAEGRTQSKEESKRDSEGIQAYLDNLGIQYEIIPVDMLTPYVLYHKILQRDRKIKDFPVPISFQSSLDYFQK